VSSKSVGLKGGSHGLEHPEPTRHRRNKAPVSNARRGFGAKAGEEVAVESLPKKKAKPTKRRAQMTATTDEGSMIDRRVGQGRANVKRAQARPEKKRRDAYVDTSKKGVAADDKKVGAGHTARRNTKLNTSGMTATLEDSATGKPSRKSTRKSANRSKPNQLTRRTKRKLHSPESRAARSRARA